MDDDQIKQVQGQLLGCPFCGSEPKLSLVSPDEYGDLDYPFLDVYCVNNECRADVEMNTYSDRHKSLPEDALPGLIKDWNTRAREGE